MKDHTRRIARPALLVAGLLLIAASLRAPIIGVAPVLAMIQSTFDLSQAQAGILTTLPLLAFAALSPFAATIARDHGLERTLFGALIVIAGGIIVRFLGSVWSLYIGTWIIGCGIAIGNVLMMSLIKRDFPSKVHAMTGACAMMMGAAAALASATAVPLAELPGFGWPMALAVIILLPAAATILWLPQLRHHTAPAKDTAAPPEGGGRVWRSALAWQVTLFMGLNSFLYYTLAGWLPSVLSESGFSAAEAGSFHGAMQLASTVPGLLLPLIVGRMRDQRAIAVAMSLLTAATLFGFLLAPSLSLLWSVCFGMSTGATLILALTFMALRVGNAHQAAHLSGMAQSIGYLLAALGPYLAGKAHDLTGDWSRPLIGCAVLAVVLAVFGVLAGRDLQIGNSRSIGSEQTRRA